MANDYLESAKKQFAYYKMLGEQSFTQVSDPQLFWQYHADSNSMATIVKHLWGNMLSRWTDFLHTDGEKATRDREAEFENDLQTRAAVLAKWEEGWACLFQALDALTADDLSTTVYIRNQGHTVTEAINRQLTHYAYHVGQLVFLGKMLAGADWMSLSIPKGNSPAYNAEKFAQAKAKKHFTDEFLSDKQE